MTFSALISGTVPHHNKYSSRNGQPVVRVLQHHFAGFSDEPLTGTRVSSSATYIIYTDGTIKGQVPEEFRPWTSGSFEADGGAITIEVQNNALQINNNDNDPGSYTISDDAYNAIVHLIADIAVRYGWGAISDGTYQGHRQWLATSCPGGYIWHRMGDIRAYANGAINGTTQPAPVPITPPVEGKTIWQLADEVLAGLHGSGEARKNSLGGNYNAVQAEVNRRLGAGPANVPVQIKSIDQLVDEVIAGVHGNGADRERSLGARHAEVQNAVNARLGGGGVAPQGANIAALADAVLRGEFGNGVDRENALGVNAKAVQDEVNRRLGGGGSAPAAVDIGNLAARTIAGEFGNGVDRQNALGVHFNAVQAEVNRQLGY